MLQDSNPTEKMQSNMMLGDGMFEVHGFKFGHLKDGNSPSDDMWDLNREKCREDS